MPFRDSLGEGVDGGSVHPDFEMQVRAGRCSCGPDPTDGISDGDPVSHLHPNG